MELRKQENAFLIGITNHIQKKFASLESLAELKSLTKTARTNEVGSVLVEVRQISPATYLGSGKVAELAFVIKNAGAHVVIFDTELAPSQSRNLEAEWGVRVIDRTNLILDIFALHATSREGKLQVELAQYEYLLPRLVGAWTHLSKQRGGGVGLRGPGETQLEVDRRRAREKISKIKQSLIKVNSSRELHRQKRESVPIPTVTLVGYTNAGKSTLFNSLVDASQYAEDKLFATLDPKTRRLKLPSGREVLLTDTVGFIRNLPHQLIKAFHSTFEEAGSSNLLLHVIDTSQIHYRDQMKIVQSVLTELSLERIPIINVMNKIDQANFEPGNNGNHGNRTIAVSALQKKGLETLLKIIDEELASRYTFMRLFLPYTNGYLLSALYRHGRILKSSNLPKGINVEVALPPEWQNYFQKYLIRFDDLQAMALNIE